MSSLLQKDEKTFTVDEIRAKIQVSSTRTGLTISRDAWRDHSGILFAHISNLWKEILHTATLCFVFTKRSKTKRKQNRKFFHQKL